MAGIGGLSGSGTGGIRGYGGLASGLDRDELIKNMTYATTNKISVFKQKRQTVQWQQESMRGITDKLYQLSNKFMSYASSSNLLSGKPFSRSKITALGANSQYISVSGNGTSADTLSVLGVKNLASNAKLSMKDQVTDQIMQSGEISGSLKDTTDADVVSGESIFVQYGKEIYTVTLPQGGDQVYKTAEHVQLAMEKAMGEITVGKDKTLADVMEVGFTDDQTKTTLTFKNKADDDTGNTLMLVGSTGDLLEDLGFVTEDENFDNLGARYKIITKGGLEAREVAKPTQPLTIAEQLSKKEISFVYNGVTKWIKLDDYSANNTGNTGETLTETLAKDLQKKLDDAFGKGRIEVKGDASKLAFRTTLPGTGTLGPPPNLNTDSSSVLSISAADRGILGKQGVFNVKEGVSNRLNTSVSLKDSGIIRDVPSDTNEMIIWNKDISGKGEPVDLAKDYKLTWDSPVSEIISTINGIEELGIKITYQSNTDRFVVESTQQGASGNIDLSGNIADILFGSATTEYVIDHGKDATVLVQYAGSDTSMEITRSSNTLSVDGLNLTLKGTFGYDEKGNHVATTEKVTFDAQVDTEATSKLVEEMVTAFNEVLALINKEGTTKPNREFAPLTDEQREGLSESEVKKWEEEAKKGLLFNDTDLRSLANNLRFILPTEDRAALSHMGITVSTDYADNGKLVFDADKFKAALAKDPEAAKKLFTAEIENRPDGTQTEGGLMVKMKKVVDRYASTTGSTKGVLIERAGSVFAPTSILKNSMQKQMDSIDKNIKQLQNKLKIEQDRYISQFTSLETLISQMNSQSSYLSSMFMQQ